MTRVVHPRNPCSQRCSSPGMCPPQAGAIESQTMSAMRCRPSPRSGSLKILILIAQKFQKPLNVEDAEDAGEYRVEDFLCEPPRPLRPPREKIPFVLRPVSPLVRGLIPA